MSAQSYSNSPDLRNLVDRAIDDHKETVITRPDGSAAVIVSMEDWSSTKETLFLLSSQTNAAALRASIEQLDAGQGIPKTIKELEAATDSSNAESG